MNHFEFAGICFADARRATAAFLDWYLVTRVDAYATADSVFAQLARDIADRHVARPEWLTDDLIRVELLAALKQMRFENERASETLTT